MISKFIKSSFIVIVIFLGLSNFLEAQVWLKDGQEWLYEVEGGWDPILDDNISMFILKDTILDGFVAKEVWLYNPSVSYHDSFIVRAENDSVMVSKSPEW